MSVNDVVIPNPSFGNASAQWSIGLSNDFKNFTSSFLFLIPTICEHCLVSFFLR